MKKKLEADLISIAHRILKLKNKSDINQLYLETQKLYEKLAILKFVDENFDEVKPTISHSEISAEIETIFENKTISEEILPAETAIENPIQAEEAEIEKTPEPVVIEETPAVEEPVAEEPVAAVPEEITPEPAEEITEEPKAPEIEEPEVNEEVEKTEEPKSNIGELSFTTVSDLKPIPDFKPAFELDLEEIKEEVKEEPKIESKSTPIPIAFEDFGINYADAQFVKVDSFEPVSSNNDLKEQKSAPVLETSREPKSVSLNDKLAKGFHIDLNDRIAFTKNLFGNSTEDYSRVLNQLLTFDSYAEAKDFIENMVKPDYNNWEGKDDYAERFLGIVEKKFS